MVAWVARCSGGRRGRCCDGCLGSRGWRGVCRRRAGAVHHWVFSRAGHGTCASATATPVVEPVVPSARCAAASPRLRPHRGWRSCCSLVLLARQQYHQHWWRGARHWQRGDRNCPGCPATPPLSLRAATASNSFCCARTGVFVTGDAAVQQCCTATRTKKVQVPGPAVSAEMQLAQKRHFAGAASNDSCFSVLNADWVPFYVSSEAASTSARRVRCETPARARTRARAWP